jgi:hypothetical protein
MSHKNTEDLYVVYNDDFSLDKPYNDLVFNNESEALEYAKRMEFDEDACAHGKHTPKVATLNKYIEMIREAFFDKY